jgi:hypothetical protein
MLVSGHPADENRFDGVACERDFDEANPRLQKSPVGFAQSGLRRHKRAPRYPVY